MSMLRSRAPNARRQLEPYFNFAMATTFTEFLLCSAPILFAGHPCISQIRT